MSERLNELKGNTDRQYGKSLDDVQLEATGAALRTSHLFQSLLDTALDRAMTDHDRGTSGTSSWIG